MSNTIHLNKEQQIYLMEMLEAADPATAVEKFTILMAEEKADPIEMQEFLIEIMKVDLEKYYEKLKKKGK